VSLLLLLLQEQHQQTLQGKFLLQVDEVVNIAAGFKDRCGVVGCCLGSSLERCEVIAPAWHSKGSYSHIATGRQAAPQAGTPTSAVLGCAVLLTQVQ
jgi:hypothetical protein